MVRLSTLDFYLMQRQPRAERERTISVMASASQSRDDLLGSLDPTTSSSTSDVSSVELLKRAWRNEKAAREILQYEEELVDTFREQIQSRDKFHLKQMKRVCEMPNKLAISGTSAMLANQRNTIYARVDASLRKIRETSEAVQVFAGEYLKTPLGEPVKGKTKKSGTELWIEKFHKKTVNLPEPLPHELVERLEKYLNSLEEQLVDLSSLLDDHRLQDAHLNSSDIFQSTIFTQQYVDRVLASKKENMRCCEINYKMPVQSSQTFIYGGILVAGFIVYFLVIFFSSPNR